MGAALKQNLTTQKGRIVDKKGHLLKTSLPFRIVPVIPGPGKVRMGYFKPRAEDVHINLK